MVEQSFTTPVAIVIGEFGALFDVVPGDQNKTRTLFVRDDFRDEIAIARMV